MDDQQSHRGQVSLKRDRLTFLTYGMAIVFGFGVAAMGPAMPLLREDLGISRTIGGLHFTAVAAGSVLAGLVAERFTGTWGRRPVFWVGGAGVAAGSLLIGAGWHPAVTLLGAFGIGFLGAALLTASQSVLSGHHTLHRAIVLTEVNTAASIGSVLPDGGDPCAGDHAAPFRSCLRPTVHRRWGGRAGSTVDVGRHG